MVCIFMYVSLNLLEDEVLKSNDTAEHNWVHSFYCPYTKGFATATESSPRYRTEKSNNGKAADNA